MLIVQKAWELISPLLPVLAVIIVFVGAGRLAYRISGAKPGAKGSSRVRLQGTLLVLTLAGLLALVLVLPVDTELRGQLLSLLGIVLTAVIALASTTFVGNVMAGMMIGTVRNFSSGDFIEVKEYAGRVTEHDLLSTEIQTRERDLITLPNLFLVVNPVKVIRKSGTVVSATVSLGYDVPREQIERALLRAAAATELQEPFVRIDELGDFSVTYRIAGLLTETRHLLTTRSRLRGATLDALHEAGIEIVSPNFMNTRAIDADVKFIPPLPPQRVGGMRSDSDTSAEQVVFDKATKAERLELLKREHEKACADIKTEKELLKANPDEHEKKRIELHIEFLERRCERLAEQADRLADHIEQDDESDT